MVDILQAGVTWLAQKLRAHASQEITYERGPHKVALPAVIGRTLMRLSDGMGGVRMEWTDLDILVRPGDLVLDGSVTLPQRGDRIYRTIGGTTYVYEVMAPGGEPEWRWSDAHGAMLRIHAKQVGMQ